MGRQSKLAVAIAKENGTYRKPGMGLDRRRKEGHHDWKSEVDAEREVGTRGGGSCPETMLIAAVIEDAVRVLCKGHPRKWWGGRVYMGYRRPEWEELYRDTVEWMFVEDEPDTPLSFHWCIETLNAYLGLDYDADTIRKRVREMALIPEGDLTCVTLSLRCSAASA